MFALFFLSQIVIIPLLVAWLLTYRRDSALFFQAVRDVAITLTWSGFALCSDVSLEVVFWLVSAVLLMLPANPQDARVRTPDVFWHLVGVAYFVFGAFVSKPYGSLFFLVAFALRFGVFPLHGMITHTDDSRIDSRLFSNLHLPLVVPFVAAQLDEQFAAHESLRTVYAIFFACAALYIAFILLTENKPQRFLAQLNAWQVCVVMTLAFANYHEPLFHLVFFTLAATLPFGALLISYRLMAQRLKVHSFDERLVLNQLIPGLAAPFLLISLAVVFSPLTVGFIAEEISLAELFAHSFSAGIAVLLSSVLIASRLYGVYTQLFLGRCTWSRAAMGLKISDRFILFVLLLLIIVPGIFPRLAIEGVWHGIAKGNIKATTEKG